MFTGLRIVDLSTVLAGPSVATFFAELGAEVIKIEHPQNRDVTRSWLMKDETHEVSAYFSSINYRKSYCFLDLIVETDYQQAMDLVASADVVILNFKKGDDLKLKITDQQLRAMNKNLIIGKISGFGSESDRVAYDLILQAETGFMSMNGSAVSGPIKMPVALIDVLAAHQLKEGLLLALLEKERKGSALSVEVSLYDAAICSLSNQASNYLMNHKVPERMGSLHPNIAPYGELFLTQDDHWVTFAIGSDRHFIGLCETLNLKDLPLNSLYNNNVSRVKNRELLFEILTKAVKDFKAETLFNRLSEKNVPIGRIKSLDQVFETEAAKALIREELIQGENTKRITQIAFKWK